MTKKLLTNNDLNSVTTRGELKALLNEKGYNLDKYERKKRYENQLIQLQSELVNLQRWVKENDMRVAILFEGRDAAGKGGTIKRFTEHLNPRTMRVVALSRPTDLELGQWYFRRYIKELPNKGEIVFFDRSWYNRAVVEPVMGFCNKKQYQQFMRQVSEFEHMLFEDGVKLIKFWFSIDKPTQLKRFTSRSKNPLKRWKLSPVDQKGQQLWDDYTYYKEQMFARTHTSFSPWTIVQSNHKPTARLESIRYLLSQFEYDGKGRANTNVLPDPNQVMNFNRSIYKVD